MAKNDYRHAFDVSKTGDEYTSISPEYEAELRTPNLQYVTGPLSKAVWRYMRFEHLEKSLRNRSLFFPRVDTLKEPLEGSYGVRPDFTSLRKELGAEKSAAFEKSWKQLVRETMQRMFFVTCWHMNEHESDALWGRYTQNDDDFVAVKSNLASLCVLRPEKVNLGDFEMIPKYFAGEISYVDFLAPADLADTRPVHMFKHQVFSGDKEFRAVVELYQWGFSQRNHPAWPNGVEVPISPATFYEALVPKAKNSALTEKLNRLLEELTYDIPIEPSQLEIGPAWD